MIIFSDTNESYHCKDFTHMFCDYSNVLQMHRSHPHLHLHFHTDETMTLAGTALLGVTESHFLEKKWKIVALLEILKFGFKTICRS